MDKKTLYIIGNGFDIYHGISSRYSDFKNYLYLTDRPLHDLIEEFIPADEYWSDLEAALADIDIDHVVENASQLLVSYGADDWSDSYHHAYQYETRRIIEGLSITLKSRFGKWIRQLEIPNLDDLPVPQLRLQSVAQYLTFNYTSTLTDLYQIPSSRILHIHGEAKKEQELILGHAWNPIEIPLSNEVSDSESMDTRVMEGNEIINGYFGATFKDSKKIISENRMFFGWLTEVSKIVVLGHSLSQVDEIYFKEIAANIDINKVSWAVTYYGDDERERHQSTLRSIGIPEYVVSFCRMAELYK